MESDEARSVRAVQQVIEVVFDSEFLIWNRSHAGDVGQGDDRADFPGFEINVRNAGILGGQVIGVWIWQPGVSVTGTGRR